MSSDLQSAVEAFITQNYASVFVVTAVSYDYLLNISREVEYVWRRSWTCVSTIYMVVRYIGLSYIIINGLYMGFYIHDPARVSMATYLLALWEFPIFLYASDLVMILRVYALWQRSKTILYILLTIYIPQIIVTFVLLGIYDNPKTDVSAQSSQFLNFSFCIMSFSMPPNVPLYTAIPRFVLAAMLLVLVVAQSLKETITMYKTTKRWQPNRYMKQFARDGIIYFLVNVILDIVTLLPEGSNADLFATALCYVAIASMMPRFIINVRETYDRDIKGVGIDTGFGVVSTPLVGNDVMEVSAISFANEPDLGTDQAEGVEKEGEDNLREASGSGGAIQMETFNDDAPRRV